MRKKQTRIQRIRNGLSNVSPGDRRSLGRQLQAVYRKSAGAPGESVGGDLNRLEDRLAAAIAKRDRRIAHAPQPTFPDHLPITGKKDAIIAAIRQHPVVIVSGETGSGKTTQIPKFCLEAGRGIDGKIGCTQPRRIAATMVSRRIAEELGQAHGQSVGYKIRFRDRTAPDAYIKIMTDGILLAEAQADRFLNAYDTLIVDEAHERSLNIDFILGILKKLVHRRKDLKVVITSATIDTEKFSAAFDGAPVVEVSGRAYPVEVVYAPAGTETGQEATYVDQAVEAVGRVRRRDRTGDILIFMPTEQDIRETCELIEGKKYRECIVFPLFARLSAAEQSRVFRRTAKRKVIVATNVAETSITIPGIRYVIDTGLARISRYSPRTRTTSLPISPISRSSADQRKGRCGRVENGVCIRLYSESDYLDRPRFTSPEILRTNLAEVILRMIALKLGDIAQFPFIDRPAPKSINDGFNLLKELDAITENRQRSGRQAGRYQLTPKGKTMAGLPIDPRLSRMLIEARGTGCIGPVAVIVSALSIRDPRERPVEKAAQADAARKLFAHPASDFISLLHIWGRYQDVLKREKTTGRVKKFCKTHFLSFIRMREWRDIHAQIVGILRENGLWQPDAGPALAGGPETGKDAVMTMDDPLYAAIHRSILTGFLANIAVKKDKNIYTAAKGKEAMVFPGSNLFNGAGRWIVAAEMVETSRLFARTAANIDSGWLEPIGRGLCKYTHSDPHWERSRGEVVALEQVSLFGLIIAADRPVSYSRIDPEKASDIFIQSALIDGDVKRPPGFMAHNRRLIDTVRDMENRLRRRDILVEEAVLLDFYRERLDGVCDIRTLQRRIREKGGDRFLRLQEEDLLRYRPDADSLSLFPDRVTLGSQRFECTYRFAPGQPTDGLTIRIPAQQAPTVAADRVDWLVPGLVKEKITAMIRGLPKTYRKRLVPLADTVDAIVNDMPREKSSLVNTLGRFIYQRFGVDIPASAWPTAQLPDHLRARIAITGPKGEEIRSGRDTAILRQASGVSADTAELQQARRQCEKTGLTEWDFGDLPDHIDIPLKGGRSLSVFPALETAGTHPATVNLRLVAERGKAAAAHRAGVAALLAIRFSKDLKFLKKRLTLPAALRHTTTDFGGYRRFETRLYERVVSDLFHRDIRSLQGFEAHADRVGPDILPAGQRLLDRSLPILEAYHEAGAGLSNLARAAAKNRNAADLIDHLRGELTRLVPDNFLALYDSGRLVHLPRFIRAVEIRARRALVDMEKDRAKAAALQPFTDSLRELLTDLSPSVSAARRTAVEEYFWRIEEFKVSLYAQELKTAVPVSKKRLETMLGEIRRMA